MPVTFPNAKTYKGDYAIRPISFYEAPKEGAKQVKVEINWLTYAAPYTLSFNLENQFGPTSAFSKVGALYIDNSDNASGVTIFFTDTQFGHFIPAGGRQYIPVITGVLQFYALIPNGQPAPSGLATTIISILNVFVPPSDPTADFLAGSFVTVWNGGIQFGVSQWANNTFDIANVDLTLTTNQIALSPFPLITPAGTVVITAMRFYLFGPKTITKTPAGFAADGNYIILRMRLVNAADNTILHQTHHAQPFDTYIQGTIEFPLITGVALKTTGLSIESNITWGVPNLGLGFTDGALRATAYYRPLANGE